MSSIETMSHVELLDAYDQMWDAEHFGTQHKAVRAEILTRMDSARTSSRDEIEPDKDGYQR